MKGLHDTLALTGTWFELLGIRAACEEFGLGIRGVCSLLTMDEAHKHTQIIHVIIISKILIAFLLLPESFNAF